MIKRIFTIMFLGILTGIALSLAQSPRAPIRSNEPDELERNNRKVYVDMRAAKRKALDTAWAAHDSAGTAMDTAITALRRLWSQTGDTLMQQGYDSIGNTIYCDTVALPVAYTDSLSYTINITVAQYVIDDDTWRPQNPDTLGVAARYSGAMYRSDSFIVCKGASEGALWYHWIAVGK